MNFSVVFAEKTHLPFLQQYDTHIPAAHLPGKIKRHEICIIRCDTTAIGWMRWNLFWDNTPFLNLIYLLEPFRGKGAGSCAMRYWEQHMAENGYHRLMTSTQSNENAQHFYRKLGYRDAGVLLLPGEAAELLFLKEIFCQKISISTPGE